MGLKRVISASGVLLKDDRIFVLKRATGEWRGHWCCPGGKVDEGESFFAACCRELYEETGVKVVIGDLFHTGHCQTDEKEVLNVDFLISAFKGEPKVREPGKHLDGQWMEPKALKHRDMPVTPILSQLLRNKFSS